MTHTCSVGFRSGEKGVFSNLDFVSLEKCVEYLSFMDRSIVLLIVRLHPKDWTD